MKNPAGVICQSPLSSLGNYMSYLRRTIGLAQWLNATIKINVRDFHGLETMLQPRDVNWISSCMKEKARRIRDNTVQKCSWDDGWMWFKKDKLPGFVDCSRRNSMREFFQLLYDTLPASQEPQACKFNAVFARTPRAVSLLKAILPKQSPQLSRSGQSLQSGQGMQYSAYSAIHIRTMTKVDAVDYGCANHPSSPGCIHIANPRWSSSEICHMYLSAACRLPGIESTESVFLSSASADVKQTCVRMSNFTILANEGPSDAMAHTQSGGDVASEAAFLDFFMLVEARRFVGGYSTFTRSAALIKDLTCRSSLVKYNSTVNTTVQLCA